MRDGSATAGAGLESGRIHGLAIAVACCGAGYVTLSGVLLVWGARATAEDPATGVGILFFMLAVGQVAGSLLFGQLYASLGASTALTLFAVSALLLLFIVPAPNSSESGK